MPHAIVDGLALVDTVGRAILATTILCLIAAVAANLWLRGRYGALERDLEHNRLRAAHPLLNRILDSAIEATRRSGASGAQAIIEERFAAEMERSLLAERFVRAATGLVIILGLLGTFYGLTLSIGRIVGLVAGDAASSDVAGAVTAGLTHALTGMAVAFSNSLVGIVSAVILTLFNVVSNVGERRTALLLKLETRVEQLSASGVADATQSAGNVVAFLEAIARLEGVVARFESGLSGFAASSRDFHEFNVHLKDNIQRMSLSFGDLSDTLQGQVVALKSRDGR
ncbi:MAG TPA: hypothetical protein VGL86_24415 [Polyangia bacterium]|jgi:hypothetical protein